MTTKPKRRSPDERSQRASLTRPPSTSRLPWLLAVGATLAVPVTMSLRGFDPFRLPKDLLVLGFAIAIAVASITTWLRSARRDNEWSAIRTVPFIAMSCVLWTMLTSLFSSNHALSNRAIVWVAAIAVFACAVDLGGRSRGMRAMAWPLIASAVNAVLFLLQRFHIWNPMTFPADLPDHVRYTALLGNPDDVGSLLVLPTLVAIALVLCDRARRAFWIPLALLFLAAIGTGRLTALLACGAGLMAMGFIRSRRGGAIAAALLIVAGVVLITVDPPLRARVANIRDSLRAHDFSEATSGRVTPFVAATMMAIDHPLVGVGPGSFRWSYFDYKRAAERRHPSLAKAWSADFNFAETHNDHLQTLAEGGVPGYALFVAALVVLAASSRRKPAAAEAIEETERDRLVRTVALPSSVAISVLCLAHFPFHLSASTVVILFIAVLCVSWGRHAELAIPPAGKRALLALVRPRSLASPVALTGIGILIVAGTLSTWQLVWRPWKCNLDEKVVEARTNAIFDSVADPFRRSRNARENLELLAPCIAAAPHDVALYMLAAANARLLGRLDDAASMYRNALQYDRRPELYYNLGLVELELNQRDAAIADLLTAVTFSRTYLQELPADVKDQITGALRARYPYLMPG